VTGRWVFSAAYVISQRPAASPWPASPSRAHVRLWRISLKNSTDYPLARPFRSFGRCTMLRSAHALAAGYRSMPPSSGDGTAWRHLRPEFGQPPQVLCGCGKQEFVSRTTRPSTPFIRRRDGLRDRGILSENNLGRAYRLAPGDGSG
jgi:hypothetical protein